MRKDMPKIELVLTRYKGALVLIDSDPFDISKRIREIEPEYFICYNKHTNAYEVHSTLQPITDTYCFTVPYEELDARTLEHCRETNLATRGDNIEKDIEANNEAVERSQKKANENLARDIAEDMAEVVDYGLNQDTIRSGYKGTHTMPKPVPTETSAEKSEKESVKKSESSKKTKAKKGGESK